MAQPEKIGSYPVQREIGRGGMGIVYLGHDPRLDRPVALKVLPEEFTKDDLRLKRFEREAKLLASLHHTNIASIFGIEAWEERPVLVLEYVPGKTLAEMIGNGRLPIKEALETCRLIALGLEAAHEK